ncbi:MAG: putative phosphoribosyltransferase [Verrucomicrobiales bacterium]|nr:putative phosphoribosyltransferase [Verrucomicrobiales bacterium]
MATGFKERRAEQDAAEVSINIDGLALQGELIVPENAAGVVIFAHGSGSSRHSPRNQFVARTIRNSGNGTLLFDLLTRAEEATDNLTGQLRFDIALLANRLVQTAHWLHQKPGMATRNIGFFGSSTGGGAALVAAAKLGTLVQAVVSRGGRPDLAADALPKVKCPTLLLVGELDDVVIRLNEQAFAELRCPKELKIIPNATHLFEESGTLEQVAREAARWFQENLSGS